MSIIEVKVPDLGGEDNIPVIDILMSVGDKVSKEDSLITLESDKATMDVPAPEDGTITEVLVKLGDNLGNGSVIAMMEVAADASEEKSAPAAAPVTATAASKPASDNNVEPPKAADAAVTKAPADDTQYDTQLLVIGSGPGGYTAAFRAADLGLKVTMVERYDTVGGVCLNVGCIPSKALLHAAKVIEESKHANEFGVTFNKPDIDIAQLGDWKQSVVGKLTGGIQGLAKQRKVSIVHGWCEFKDAHTVTITDKDGAKSDITFAQAVIAAGSSSVKIPGIPFDHPHVIDSTGALELKDVPKRMLVVGGGIIGLEMATVYHSLGSAIDVVELGSQIIPGADADIIKPYFKKIKEQYANIFLNTKVDKIEADGDQLMAHFSGEKADTERYDKVLVAVGRTPNGQAIKADNAGVEVDARGFIRVDAQQRTNVAHIFAIGDIVGQPMLAHKATHEGKVAAEVAAGEKSGFEASVIPSVAYTDPEIAWIGVTENQAKEQGLNIGKATFPWAANGRALSMQSGSGLTKLIFDKESHRLIGAAAVGPSAGELVGEMALAIEMGCDASDIGLTIHAHPTLSETVAMAAEMYEGTITDLYIPQKKK